VWSYASTPTMSLHGGDKEALPLTFAFNISSSCVLRISLSYLVFLDSIMQLFSTLLYPPAFLKHMPAVIIVKPTRCTILEFIEYHSTCFGLSVHHKELKTVQTALSTSYSLVACMLAGTGWNCSSRARQHAVNEPV